MTTATFFRRIPSLLLGTVLAGAMLAPVPAAAQDDASRLRKLEAEVKALQRKVFPGGGDKYFEPEITAAQPAQPTAIAPAGGPVTDLLARMDTVEAALARASSRSNRSFSSIAPSRSGR